MAYRDPETARTYWREYDANRREEKREYATAYRAANKDKINGLMRDRKARYAEKKRASNAVYREQNRAAIAKKKRMARYGLTSEEYDALVAPGLCQICGQPWGEPHIDHCHATGKVRGALCRSCNHGIGMLKDDPKIMQSAIEYLQRHKGLPCSPSS